MLAYPRRKLLFRTLTEPNPTQSQSHFPPDFDPDNLDPRLDASVESDIVGYTTIDLKAGFNLYSCAFNNVSGNSASHDLQALLHGDLENGDSIMFYREGGGYDTFYYQDEVYDSDWTSLGRPGWATAQGIIAMKQVSAGEPFWLNVSRDKAVQIAGSVSTEPQQMDYAPGLSLVAFAAPRKESESKADLLGTGFTPGDELQVHNDNGSYTTYYYLDNVYDASWNPQNHPGWTNAQGIETKIEIPENAAFWLSTQKGGSVTVASPIQK